MSNLNWPEGATHYLQAGEEQTRFRDLSGDKWKYFNGYTGEWVEHYFSSEDLLRRHDLIARPQPKPWSGPEDGLPPVGLEVQRMSGRIWVDSKALAHSPCGKFCAYADDHGMNWGGASMFRPTKTPEQVANDKRETAIADMAKVLPGAKIECYTFNADGSVRPYSHIREVLELLVDAGFKREGV